MQMVLVAVAPARYVRTPRAPRPRTTSPLDRAPPRARAQLEQRALRGVRQRRDAALVVVRDVLEPPRDLGRAPRDRGGRARVIPRAGGELIGEARELGR